MTNVPRESAVIRAIEKWFKKQPMTKVCKHWGNQLGEKRPDLNGSYMGRHIEIEVKRPGGKATKAQQKMIDDWLAAGAIAGTVTSVEELEALIKEQTQ